MSPLRRALRNTSYLVGGKGAGALMGLLTTALAARTLGLGGFGVLLLIHALANTMSAATRLQSWQPLLQFGSARFAAGERILFARLLRFAILLDAVGALAGALLGMPLGWFGASLLGWSGHGAAAALYLSSTLFMNTGAAMGLMRLADRYRSAAVADTAAAALRLGGAAAGTLGHWSLGGFLAAWYAATVLGFAVNWFMARRIARNAPSLRGFALRGSWRAREPGMGRLVFATSGNQALIGLSSRLTTILVGAALGPDEAALFRVAAQVGEAVSQPAQMLTPALYPEFVRLRDGHDWRTLRRMVRRVFQGLAAFSVLAIALAALAGPFLLAAMLGVHAPHVRVLLVLVALAATADLWDVPLEPLLVSLGRARVLLHGRLAVMVVTLPLFFLLSRLMGVQGAATAALVQEVAVFGTRLVPFLRLR
ncbi:MAG: lipopolysaccharide biosynthesis protein [Gluconacetobacter diazotrophicus]|nr:lipopolysaccharide biosynthesis protein [Gluconacetobacter diazotrophicus]